MKRPSTVSTPSYARPALRGLAVTLTAAAILAVSSTAAWAHGVTGTGGAWYNFIWSGFIHMLAGWDHLLFAGGVVLLSGTIRRATQMISLFALGHSTTLIIATMLGWRINATLVDIVIALSLVFIACVGWVGRPTTWRWFGLSVLGFGLIHGLGLSTRLQDVGLPHETVPLLARVIAFNVGVELGQLFAIGLLYMLGNVLSRYLTWRHTWKVAYATLGVVGLLAGALLATGVTGTVSTPPGDAAAAETSTIEGCQVRKRTESYPGGATGTHPRKDFYEPSETIPVEDFGHVLGDSMILVHYQPDLSAEQLDTLRAFVTGQDGSGVLAGPEPGQTEAFKAVNKHDTMVCTEFNLKPLITFKSKWFADPASNQ